MKDHRVSGPSRGAAQWALRPQFATGADVNAHDCELPGRGGVYVDAAVWHWQGLKWAHLLADDTDELHRFAARLGIHRASYQGPPRTSVPHYDLTPYERHRAIALGAIACSREEIVAIVRRTRRRIGAGWVERSETHCQASSRS
jgi:hypothetical protein